MKPRSDLSEISTSTQTPHLPVTHHKGFNVGGVLLPTPFKARRLSHIVTYYDGGFKDLARFWIGNVGLHLSDCRDETNSPRLKSHVSRLKPFAFMRISGVDHHNFAFVPKSIPHRSERTKIHHYAWDLGSYDELREFLVHCRRQELSINGVGRRMPGSNYTVYYEDPEENLQHMQWYMEMPGWKNEAKPVSIWSLFDAGNRGGGEELEVCVKPDEQLTQETLAELDRTGQSTSETSIENYRSLLEDIKAEFRDIGYNVHGTILPRPFSLAKLTYLEVFANNLNAMTKYYTSLMGFKISDRTKTKVYLRHGADHHSLVLVSPEDSLSSGDNIGQKIARIGIQVRTYRELVDSARYFSDLGIEILGKGRSFPGGEYYVDIQGPERLPIRLFFYMERIGWDGKSRPKDLWKPLERLPNTAEASDDVYNEELPGTYSIC